MHIPVLLKEVLEFLNPQPDQNFVDCTVGGGGHSLKILKAVRPNGRVLGIDQDEQIIKRLEDRREETGDNLILVRDNYSNLKSIVAEKEFGPVSGVLFDLGMSSWDIESSGRGFSFQKDEPLDMRYSQEQDLTAEKIIGQWTEAELEKIFKECGQERFARRIARAVVEQRKTVPIKTTGRLAEVISRTVPRRFQPRKIHPATRVFQALRIAVNDELDNVERGLEAATEVLVSGGRIVVISFHSLEDRIVKNFFRQRAREGELQILTKKPIIPDEEEVRKNPRSRSAKMRAAQKL